VRILIAAPVHQKEHIFKAYLESLGKLMIPANCEVDRFFILHNCEELLPLIQYNSLYAVYNTDDKYRVDEVTHHWTDKLVAYVAGMKNSILKFAKDNNYDYLFFVDSDLILHPMTLIQLLKANKDIIAEVFWTSWGPGEPEMPNAWDYNTYDFNHDRRLEEWKTPGVYAVGMTGACTLIKKQVIQAGVDFNNVYNVNFWGEDRHFCVRAAAHDFGIWLDTHYPCIHLYRDSEYEKWKAGDTL
jgi:hypothetical protein